MGTTTLSLTVLTKQDCPLCTEALARLRVPTSLLGVRIEEVTVDDHGELYGRFGMRVPVLLAGGEVLAEGRITAGEAWRAAWRARRGPRRPPSIPERRP